MKMLTEGQLAELLRQAWDHGWETRDSFMDGVEPDTEEREQKVAQLIKEA